MRTRTARVVWLVFFLFGFGCCAWGDASVELAKHEGQFSNAHIELARMDSKIGIGVFFDGSDDLHFYAKKETAPVVGFELQVEAKSEDFVFGDTVFPKWNIFEDSLGNKVEVYAGRFSVFIPIKSVRAPTKTTTIEQGDVEVRISGQACTSTICLQPFEKKLNAKINWSQKDSLREISFGKADGSGSHFGDDDHAAVKGGGYSVLFALGLSVLAGLSLNIMPCVWPVLPIIVMRLVEQARAARGRAVAMGFVFCGGILLFFACLAAANIILRLVYGTVLQWGDPLRIPAFVGGMALLLVVMALFMFGVFTIGLPSAVAGKTPTGKGFAGAAGMGFLAAVLSTPCSFAILATAFAWAQAQALGMGSLGIIVIGVGMALPYAILTSMPGLLSRLPKAGRWMEVFKQAIGFVLLGIAIWLLAALPQGRRIGVLYFALVLSFCVWMWAGWVSYNTPTKRKWVIRVIAMVIAAWAGFVCLRQPTKLVDWQEYDGAVIERAISEQKPVLIKFTADWCVSCKVVDKVVYSRGDIAGLIKDKGVVAIAGDTTVQKHPATLALKNKYHEPGVPVSVLFLPGRAEPIRWRDKLFGDELKAQLEKIESE